MKLNNYFNYEGHIRFFTAEAQSIQRFTLCLLHNLIQKEPER